MTEILNSAGFVALITAVTTILTIVIKEVIIPRINKKTPIADKDKSMFYLEMDVTCSKMRKELNADGVYIAYFHNGGYFSNGISMDKFTVVGEDYNTLIRNPSYKKSYAQTMISYISYAYHRMLVDNIYCACTLKDIADISYKNDLQKRGVASTYSFIIRDVNTDKPIGFVSLEFTEEVVLDSIGRNNIWKRRIELSRLLNMTVLDS